MCSNSNNNTYVYTSFVSAYLFFCFVCPILGASSNVYAWGDNEQGQLGLGNITTTTTITRIGYYNNSIGFPLKAVYAGANYHLAMYDGDVLYGSGDNEYGQLGNNKSLLFNIPIVVAGVPNNYTLFAADNFVLAFNAALQTLYGWGFARGFEKKDMSSDNYWTLKKLDGAYGFDGKVLQIATGTDCFYIYITNGTLWMGVVSSDDTGNVLNRFELVPSWQTDNLDRIYSTNVNSTCARSSDGSLYCWGQNAAGQLGLGHTRDVSEPQQILVFGGLNYTVNQFQQGKEHAVALTCGGRVYAWGSNQRGQLGFGTVDNGTSTPTEIIELRNKDVVQIVSGAYHNFARTGSNEWYVWGDKTGLGLGDSDGNPITTPTLHNRLKELKITHIVSTPSSWSAIAWLDDSTAANLAGCPKLVANYSMCAVPSTGYIYTLSGYKCTCAAGYVGDGIDYVYGGSGCRDLTECGNGIVDFGEECDGINTTCCVECVVVRTACYAPAREDPCVQEYRCNDGLECAAYSYVPCPDFSICSIGKCIFTSPGDYEAFCGDGVCGTNENCQICPLDCKNPCPTDCTGKIRCSNGNCVNTTEECDPKCDDPTQFRCASSACVSDFADCGAGQCNGTFCWDGTCVKDIRACLPVPACPKLTRRCAGSCLDKLDICELEQTCSDGAQLCLSGNCGFVCEAISGCGNNLIMCEDSKCVTSYEDCNPPPENCTSNCEVPFTSEKPSRFNVTIHANESIEIPVLSATGRYLGKINIEANTFAHDTVLFIEPVEDSVFQNTPNPSYWGSNTTNRFSSSFDLNLGGDKQPFLKNISLSFAYDDAAVLGHNEMVLGYISQTDTWEQQSELNVSSDYKNLVGTTNHFTPFAACRRIHAPTINKLDDITVLENADKNSIIIYIYVGLFVIFALAFRWSIWADRKFKRYSTKPGELKALDVKLEPLNTQQNEISASVSQSTVASPSGSVAGSTVSSPRSVASNEDWHDEGVDYKEYRRRGRSATQQRIVAVKDSARFHFKQKHKWLSIYYSPRISTLSRTARVMILLCMVLSNMAIASAFYNGSNYETIGQAMVTGIITSAISFVCAIAIFLIFTKAPKRYIVGCYIFSGIYCVGTAFITFWYNIGFAQGQAQKWCISTSTAVVQDGIVNETVKILLLSFLIGCFPNIPFLSSLQEST